MAEVYKDLLGTPYIMKKISSINAAIPQNALNDDTKNIPNVLHLQRKYKMR